MTRVMGSGGSQGAGYSNPTQDEARCGRSEYLKIG